MPEVQPVHGAAAGGAAAGGASADAVSGVVAVLSSHASFAMHMRRAGFEVIEGRDIDDLARTAPTADIVVADLVAVEGKRGLVARLSTAVDPRIPVVLISADDVDVALLGTSRPVHVVVPPVRADDVVACVRQVLAASGRRGGGGDASERPGPDGRSAPASTVTPIRPRRRLRSSGRAATTAIGPTAPKKAPARAEASVAARRGEPAKVVVAKRTGTAPKAAAPTVTPVPAVVDLSTLPPPLLDWRVVMRQMASAVQGVPTAGAVAQVLAEDLAAVAEADVAVLVRDPAGLWIVEGGVGLRAFEWAQTLEDTDWIVVAGRGEHLSLMVRDTDVVRGDLVGAPLASRLQLVRTHSSRAAFFVCAAWADGGDEQERVAHVVRAVRRHEAALADAVELRDFARWLSSRVDGAGTDTDEQV
jgi:hypothetical protein